MHVRSTATLLMLALVFCLTACDDKNTDDSVDANQVSDARPGEPAPSEEPKDVGPDTSEEPERTEATSQNAGTVNETPPLPVDKFFSMGDVTSLAKGGLKSAQLAGQKPSETYNSLRIYPAGRSDYGAALQLWKFDSPKAAVERVSEMREQYLGVSEPAPDAPVKDRSAFISSRQKMWQYVFNPKDKPYVASVTCQEKFCRDIKVVYEIGSKVNTRILEAGTDDAPAKDADDQSADEPSDAKPSEDAQKPAEDKKDEGADE